MHAEKKKHRLMSSIFIRSHRIRSIPLKKNLPGGKLLNPKRLKKDVLVGVMRFISAAYLVLTSGQISKNIFKLRGAQLSF